MDKKYTTSNEQQRHWIVEKMWLNFYNDHLLEQGIITESQHKKMQTIISSRKPSALS